MPSGKLCSRQAKTLRQPSTKVEFSLKLNTRVDFKLTCRENYGKVAFFSVAGVWLIGSLPTAGYSVKAR